MNRRKMKFHQVRQFKQWILCRREKTFCRVYVVHLSEQQNEKKIWIEDYNCGLSWAMFIVCFHSLFSHFFSFDAHNIYFVGSAAQDNKKFIVINTFFTTHRKKLRKLLITKHKAIIKTFFSSPFINFLGFFLCGSERRKMEWS